MLRKDIVSTLEKARVACSPSKETLEQSTCFIFTDGMLWTFDGEMASRQPSPFGEDIKGAVGAGDFCKILQRFPDEQIDVSVKDGECSEIIIAGKRRKAGVTMYRDILLPVHEIPGLKKWTTLEEDVMPRLVQAAYICGSDETSPRTTHVHITPDRIESTDSFRVFRDAKETGFPKECLLHSSLILRMRHLHIRKVYVGEGWVHFKEKGGMVLSCAMSLDSYYEEEMLNKHLEFKGASIHFPSNLRDMLSRAEVMDTANNAVSSWSSQVTLSFKDKLLTVSSQKEEGWFKETKKVKYSGPPLKFTIHPDFLKDILDRTHKVKITDQKICIKTGDVLFVTSLETTQE